MKSSQRVLARQWRLIQALSGSRMGLSIKRLMEVTETSRQTVYRDLRLLREAGIFIEPETVNGEARYRMLRALELPQLGLNALQVSALRLARAQLQGLTGAGFISELDALLERYTLPERQLAFGFAAKSEGKGADRAQVMKGIERALGVKADLRFGDKRAGDVERSVLEPWPGLGATVSLEDGIRRTAEWFAQHRG